MLTIARLRTRCRTYPEDIVLALTWRDVNWDHKRLTVRSPKIEHHEGRAERIVPIFPEVLPLLEEAYARAPEGAVHLITRYREGANLNPHFRRIIQRAGYTPWPRTWHNLRASRQTELASEFPIHTVCAWMGNSKMIAAGHYLQVTDPDWERATGTGVDTKVAQNGSEQTLRGKKPEKTAQTKTLEFPKDSEGFVNVPVCCESTNGQGRT